MRQLRELCCGDEEFEHFWHPQTGPLMVSATPKPLGHSDLGAVTVASRAATAVIQFARVAERGIESFSGGPSGSGCVLIFAIQRVALEQVSGQV